MSNERLRGAIIDAGLTAQSLSELVGVDPKTVERWITSDRTPHRTHRAKTATALSKSDGYLWPSTAADPRLISASRAELVALYPNRGAVPISVWTSLIDEAKESIDLLAFAGSFLHDSVPDFGERLTSRARAGVRVRLLFGDPSSEAVALRGREERIDDLVSARCRLTWNYLQSALGVPGVQARQHGATLYASIFRFDEALLANTHVYGACASQSPVLHLQRIPDGRLFAHYMESFERTWESATHASE
jgi:hypothetical protein